MAGKVISEGLSECPEKHGVIRIVQTGFLLL